MQRQQLVNVRAPGLTTDFVYAPPTTMMGEGSGSGIGFFAALFFAGMLGAAGYAIGYERGHKRR